MANLLSNTTIGGYQSIHTGNIGSYALTSVPANVITTSGGQTIGGTTYFSGGESLNVYGIRGRFTNEYMHLYHKVGIGHPGGWGQGEGNTPGYGLSTYGGANFAYGNNADSTFNGIVYSTASFRAPIYYDSQNTNYYGDFAGTSNLNVLYTNYLYIDGTNLTGTQTQLLKNTLDVTTLPYKVDITVNGNANTFYAVQFWGGDQDVWRRIIIKRGYGETAPWDPIGTGVHHGGLLLDWEGNFGGWGGAEYADRIRVFNESYTNVCADMFIYSHSMGYIFMLRGGGAVYHLFSDQPINGFYQSGAPDILYSASTLSYDDAWSGTNQYDVYAPTPLTLGQVNSSRIDGLRTKKQSLLDGRYLRQGIDISGIGNITTTNSYATNFFASNAFYLNGASYYLNSNNGGIYTNARFETAGQLHVGGNAYLAGTYISGNTTWFNGQGSQIALENIGSLARFAFNKLDFYDWQHGIQMEIDGNNVYVNNYLQAGNSLRAPIFYDSNDTTYYLDPNAGTSLKIAGGIETTRSSGTMFSHGAMADAFGWNGDYGTYIGSNVGGTSYLYANGTFYTGGSFRTLIHSGNIGSQNVSYATTAGALSSMNISQFTNNSGYITSGDTTTGIFTTFLGNGTSNISSGYTRVIRNENGTGGNPNYAPILHVAASDTMWQIAGVHAGGTTLVWRSGYSGAWNTPWWTIYHSGNFTDNSSNWNTAYGWGNHASAGYLTSLPSHNHDDRYYTETESDNRYVPYGSLGGSFGLNDNKLYLRTNNDNNHYLWNAADDWEEMVYYTGTGFRIKGSTGNVSGYFTDNGITAIRHYVNTGAFMEGYGSYSSKLGRVAMISFDWNANYDEPYNHGIMSTNFDSSFSDNISINSFNDITLRLDTNGNNAESYLRIMNDTSGNNTFASIGYNGSTYFASFSRDLYVNGGAAGNFGNRLIVGGNSTPYTMQDGNLRPTVYLTGAYPVMTLNHTETGNTSHGPTIQFTFNGLSQRQWVIGCGGSGEFMDFGFSNNAYGNTNWNPHNGIAGYQGNTIMRIIDNAVGIGGDWGAHGSGGNPAYTLDVRGTIYSNTDMRAPIFYDSQDTGYYLDPNSTSRLVQINLGTTNTRLISDEATGYIKLYGSASNYLAIGPYNNNGWLYFENIGNSNGVYFNSPGRYAFDTVDVTPYSDAENSLGNGSYRWAQIYTSGWLRQYGAQGMYNQDYGTHFYSLSSGAWAITGSGGAVELQFRSNHQSTIRGYVYADTSNNIGFLNNAGNWSLRTDSSRNTEIYGSLTLSGGIVTTVSSGSVLLKHAVSEADAWIFQENAANWGLYWKNAPSGNHTFGGYTTLGAELVGMSAANSSGNGVLTSNFTGASSAYAQWMISNFNGYIWSASTIYAVGTMYSAAYRGNANVGGTGEASYHPAGIYSTGTNWLYGTMYVNGNSINDASYFGIIGTNTTPINITGASHKYLTINPGNGYEAMVRYVGGSGSSWYVGKRTTNQLVGTESFHFYSEAAGATVAGIDTSGNIHASGSMRAPIFYDSNDTTYYLDPNSTETSFRGRGEILLGPNTSGQYTRLGGNGGSVDHATVSSSNGNLHIDCKDGFGIYLNYYSRDTIYLGQSASITSDGAYYNGTSAVANSVAWTNVSSRPTALSQFTNDLGNYGGFLTSLGFSYSTGINGNHVVQRDANGYIYASHINFSTGESENPTISSFITSNGDGWSRKSSLAHVRNQLGNYGGWLTTSGKAADSELIDGIDSSRIIFGDGSFGSTNYSDMNNTAQKSGFFFYNQPTGNPFGDWTHWINCMGNSWNPNYGFQLAHAFHSNNFAVRVVANGGFSSWRTIIDSGNIGSQSVNYASSAGSAGSATNAGQLNTYGYLVGENWDTYYTSGKLRVASASGATGVGRPPSSVHNYGSLLSYGISGEDMFQMYFPDNAGNSIANSRKLHYRTGRGAWCDWRTVVDMVGDTLTIVEGGTPKIVVRGSVPYGQATSASIELVGDADGGQTQSYRWISNAPDWSGQELRLERKVNNSFQLVGRVPKNTNNLEWQGTIVQGLSDSRVKTNVVSMTEGLDKIDQIRPVTFDWVPTENVSDREGADFGFIAQELEEVLPEVVHTRGDGYKTVMYEKVVPVLVQAMKEQQALIEALRAEVELLKNK